MKPTLHFAHGNGFPSGCYTQFLNPLEKHYRLVVIDKVGHHPDYPVTDNWDYLVDEVIASVTQQCDEPVVGLGHSLGGVLTLLAAIKRPELFLHVIMIDSPLLGRFKSYMVNLAKRLGFIDSITPAKKTRKRKRFWRTKKEVYAYLKTKPLFEPFTEACLHDYVKYGVIKTDEGYTLVFDSDVEYQIFRTIPHHLHQFARQLSVPTTLLYGSESDVVSWFDILHMRYMFNMRCIKIKGTHMLPMEAPTELAAKVSALIDAMNRHQ